MAGCWDGGGDVHRPHACQHCARFVRFHSENKPRVTISALWMRTPKFPGGVVGATLAGSEQVGPLAPKAHTFLLSDLPSWPRGP